MSFQPFEIKDFSGGKTDNYLSGPLNRGREFDNLLINKNKKPYMRWGSTIENSTATQILSGVKRISYLWDHRGTILRQSESHVYYITSVPAYAELLGPTSNDAFDGATQTSHISQTFWNNHSLLVCDNFTKPIKIYKDASNALKLRTAGLPTIAAPTVTAGAAGANNYIYAFHYHYSYNVEGVTFEDFGPTVQVSLLNAAAPNVSTVPITVIPVIANTTVDNWDTTAITVKIYRTENNGTVLRYLGQVTNGTTTYNDSATDASIANAVTIYTTGGVVDNDPPPPAKFVHVANNIALYGWVKEGSVEYATKVRQSIPGDIDSCPEDFFITFPQRISGISSVQGAFIVFCEGSVHRVEGGFDELGRGGLSSLNISDTVGCVSNDSIVQTDTGVFFAGTDGFYFCDGYRVQKVSNHLNTSYKDLVLTAAQQRNIFGAYDKIEKRIWWGVQQDTGSLDNDACWILDLEWGLSAEMTFTTASNSTYFRPTCLLFKDTYMYRGDTRGYVLKHATATYTDPKIDSAVAVSAWNKATIIYDYTSCAWDFGTPMLRKFSPLMQLTLANVTNIAVQITSINDDGRSSKDLREMRYTSNVIWGNNDITWGETPIIWNKLGMIEEKKRFPAMGLRFNYKQIQITNAYTIVQNSDTIGVATLDDAAKTMTLANASAAWPADSVDYFLSTEADDYTKEFLVTTRTSDTVLVFQDSSGQAPNTGSYKWLLKGYRKGDAIEIISYVIYYMMATSSHKTFHTPIDTGENV